MKIEIKEIKENIQIVEKTIQSCTSEEKANYWMKEKQLRDQLIGLQNKENILLQQIQQTASTSGQLRQGKTYAIEMC